MKFEVKLQGVSIEVEANITPGTKGARDSFQGRPGIGIQLEPDSPAEVEIVSVTCGDDISDLLTHEQFNAIRKAILEG